MSWRVDVKTSTKRKRQKLPQYFTRTVVVWGLREDQKEVEFIKDMLSTQGKIEKITIIKMKPAIKVRFRHQDDAIKVRCSRKIFKDFPNIYLKYGKDEKSISVAPNTDEDLEALATLADSFHFGDNDGGSTTSFNMDEEMSIAATSVAGLSERGALMKRLEKHSKLQQDIQEEMEVASMISSKINALPPMFHTLKVPENEKINLDEILAEEIIDNELMSDSTTITIKCRFVILTPVSWLQWIKDHLGLVKNEVHIVKDNSRIFIRLFSWSESRQIDDAFDGILLVNQNEQVPNYKHEAKQLPEIKFNIPPNAQSDAFNSELRNQFRNAIRQSFAKFSTP